MTKPEDDSPLYVHQMMIRSGELAGWLTTSRKQAEAEGRTHFRASSHPQLAGLTLFEGWKEKPADMGEPRWVLAKAPVY